MNGKRVLVVEHEMIIAEDLRQIVMKHGLIVQSIVTTAGEALQQCCEMRPDIVLMDLQLEAGVDGLERAAQIQPYCNYGIILITALPVKKPDLPSAAMDVVRKPFEEQDLIAAIQKLIPQASSLAGAESALPQRQSTKKAEQERESILKEKELFLAGDPLSREK